MTSPFLKLFDLPFCSIWPVSIWLKLFKMTGSLFQLLVELPLYQFSGIITNACWWDTIPHKQQWQGLMCFTSGCHWESSSPSKVCGIYLCTSVAPSGHCTGKHHVWEYRMCQAMITKILIICFESSWHQRVEHSPNPSLSCGLNSHLSFFKGNFPSFSQEYWLYLMFSDYTNQLYADLNWGSQWSYKIIIIHDTSSIISQWVWDNCADKY